jgi:hypothetical protein
MVSNIGSFVHVYVEPMGMHVSVVHALLSSHEGGALRTQRRRAASQDQVPMHALLFNRWQVVSPTSQGTSVTQPEPSMQNCPLGQRMSLGTCSQRPIIALHRSSVHETLSSQLGTPPTTTHRPPMQRCAFVQKSGDEQSSSVRHVRASVLTTSRAASVTTPESIGPLSTTSARASARTPESRLGISASVHDAITGMKAIVERIER